MIGGINLHSVVRGVINMLHPDINATLYQATGQTTAGGGNVKSIYAPGRAIKAQAQSEGTTALFHADRVGSEELVRKFYLFSDPELDARVAGIIRPLSRGGDMFQIDATETWFADTWWLVEATIEDFTRSGWVNVRATLQVNPPDFSASDWSNP